MSIFKNGARRHIAAESRQEGHGFLAHFDTKLYVEFQMAIIRRKQVQADKPDQDETAGEDFSLESEPGSLFEANGSRTEENVMSDSQIDPDRDGDSNGRLETENGASPDQSTQPRRKRKIRVELIKDSGDDVSDASTENGEQGSDSASSEEAAMNGSRSDTESGEQKTSTPQGGPGQDERRQGRSKNHRKSKGDGGNREKLSINDLTRMNLPPLRDLAVSMGISHENLISMKKQDIIFAVLKAHTANNGIIHAYGSLEILPDGYGFLRSPQNSYLPGSDDIYISPSQIRLFNLRTGDTVSGQIRPPKEGERFFAMLRVESVNFSDPAAAQTRVPFDNLTPLYPDVRINMETENGEISTRMINLFCPIGKGQRGLIVSPPRTGKTILLQRIANAITTNHPEVFLIVLLIDERSIRFR